MGANIWFWLIAVFVGIGGIWGIAPWRTEANPYGNFGAWVVLFILILILGYHDFGSPIR